MKAYTGGPRIVQILCSQGIVLLRNRTGTPPLTRFFGPGKNRVKGKPRYRRSILVLKPQNGEFETLKSTFSIVFTSVQLKLQLQLLHLYLSSKRNCSRNAVSYLILH